MVLMIVKINFVKMKLFELFFNIVILNLVLNICIVFNLNVSKLIFLVFKNFFKKLMSMSVIKFIRIIKLWFIIDFFLIVFNLSWGIVNIVSVK